MNKIYIYKHTNLINQKSYIGQTCMRPEYRWNNGKGYIKSPHFYAAIQKYGWDNFSHEILEIVETQEEANQKECYYINLYHTLDPLYGYNIREGGSNGSMNPETKEKISKTLTGIRRSQETREKLSKSKIGSLNPQFQKAKTEEEKQNLSNKLKDFYQSDKGQELLKSRRDGSCYHRRVRCIETNKIYSTIRAALADLHKPITSMSITNVLKGRQLTAYGYHWEAVEEGEEEE